MTKSSYLYLATIFFLSLGCNPNSTSEFEKDKESEKEATITHQTSPTIEPEAPVEKVISKEAAVTIAKPIITKPAIKKEEIKAPATVPTETKITSFLILQSTKSYSAAAYSSRLAKEKLGLEINNRGYVFDFRAGLKDTAACQCGEMHGYTPRGRDGASSYVSIEHSNGFPEFTDGNYLVVAAVGNKSKLTPLLAAAKEHFPAAKIKKAKVHTGCSH